MTSPGAGRHEAQQSVLGDLSLVYGGGVQRPRLSVAGLGPSTVTDADQTVLDLDDGSADSGPEHQQVDIDLFAVLCDPLVR